MTHLKHEESLAFIAEVLTILKSTHQHEKVLHAIVDRVVRIYKCQTCAVVLVNPKTEYLNIANSYGLSHTFAKDFRQRLAAGAIGKLLWTGKGVLIRDSSELPELAEEFRLEHPFGSALCVQISIDHRTLGYLHADSEQPNVFTEEDIRILQAFADFAGIAIDKTELYDENLRLDTIDHETELEKHSSFVERLRESVERAHLMHEHFGVMILDVDNFKHISQTYGYDASRKLLRELANLVRSRVRSIDAAGRYGFDEFVIFRAHASPAEAVVFANELRSAVEAAVFTDREIKTTISIGVAAFPDDADSFDALLLRTKEALYQAQHAGRNTVFHSQLANANRPS